jgi:hypothetical protein
VYNIILEFLCLKNLKEIIKVLLEKKENSKAKLKDFPGMDLRNQDLARVSRLPARSRPGKSLSFSLEFSFFSRKT